MLFLSCQLLCLFAAQNNGDAILEPSSLQLINFSWGACPQTL